MVCGVAINSLKIALIVQPAHSDIKIGLGPMHMEIGYMRLLILK